MKTEAAPLLHWLDDYAAAGWLVRAKVPKTAATAKVALK
jgi:hypothetical protein